MVLIIGGAYQGKLNYAFDRFGFGSDDVYHCSPDISDIDLSKPVIYGLHRLVLALIKADIQPRQFIERYLPDLRDKIIISDDVSCGIVPIDHIERRLREDAGHCLALLSREADEVIRIFCGLDTCIKGDCK